jgi:ribosomal protein S17
VEFSLTAKRTCTIRRRPSPNQGRKKSDDRLSYKVEQDMKTKVLKLAATALIPAAWLSLTGCGSAPVNPLATQSSPALAGGFPVIETFDQKAQVTSLVPEQRTLALRNKEGNTITCKAAPQVANFSQLWVGDKVKATITDAVAIYLVKNGPPPNAGAGVEVGSQPASVVLQTTDTRGRVFQVDRSYRLLTVDYGNGSRRQFKIPLHHPLKQVQKGDEVVVRSTEPLALRVKSR